MGSRYVPPHLRKKNKDTFQGDTVLEPAEKEILAPRRLSDLRITNDVQKQLYTIYELNHHYGGTTTHSTLHEAADQPRQLGYVVLFRGANPQWKTDQTLFAHTNIHILPGYEAFKKELEAERAKLKDSDTKEITNDWEVVSRDDATPDKASIVQPGAIVDSSSKNTESDAQSSSHALPSTTTSIASTNHTPIPIFHETPGPRFSRYRNLSFHGYFDIAHISFLKPHSEELIQMLQQKWEPTHRHPNAPPSRSKRDAAAWAKSLAQEWAVVKFNPIPPGSGPQNPKIERLSDEEERKLRLKSQDGEGGVDILEPGKGTTDVVIEDGGENVAEATKPDSSV